MFSRFFRKLSLYLRRDRIRRELAEEIATHEALRREDHTAAGLSPQDAAHRARRDMGNVTLALDESADAHGFPTLDTLLQDTRYALRILRLNTAFSAMAIATLALGIGATTSVFSLVNSLLIRPLPFAEPERLVRVTEFFPKALLVQFREQCRTMDLASANPGADVNAAFDGRALRIRASSTSANLFDLLGVRPQFGRPFTAGEDSPGRDRIVVLSHALWQRQFHSDPSVIGRLITVDDVPRRIVGIMPATFAYPTPAVELWIPAPIDPRQQADYWAGDFNPIIGRLRPGATLAQARAEIAALAPAVWRMFPWPMPRAWNAAATVISLQTDLAGETRSRLLLMLCAAGAVLVIACANVAGLLTARGSARSRELAVRAALGAGQLRIVRQLLTESLILSAIAGLAGLGLATLTVRFLQSAFDWNLPVSASALDWTVAAFAAVLSLAVGIAFGIAPAWSMARLSIVGAIRAGGQRGATGASLRFRNALIIAEVALTLVLVVGASLLLRSLWTLSSVNPGFDTHQIRVTRLSPEAALCNQPERCIALYQRLLHEARELPGIVEASLSSAVPMDGSAATLAVDVEDHPKTADFPAPMFWTGAITPDYLRLMRIPLLAGRTFGLTDTRDSEPVVIIDASTARRFWPGQLAVGKHIRWVSETRWRTVVGVVADVRQFNLANRAPAGITGSMYLPYPQSIDAAGRLPGSMYLIARAAGRPSAALDSQLRDLVQRLNPQMPVGDTESLEAIVGRSVARFRSIAWLLLSFAVAAVGLASVGIYGVVAYSVTLRSYEIALRMAIGATAASVLRMMLTRSLRTGLLGIAAGVVGALVVTRGLATLLFGVSPADPLTYAAVSAFLLAVVLFASLVPAWRAARIDPVRILRAE